MTLLAISGDDHQNGQEPAFYNHINDGSSDLTKSITPLLVASGNKDDTQSITSSLRNV